ncbi:MAG: hypothetical protein Q4G22_00975 [Paracoccus sp. (in: a-proteobacteria)]|uniref:hypothetical protein n=1 Tax=Paracoccus sp. TaxID=267 RepID=UPI0026DF6801|nr:hypothetical protein [Paracoccus sp. (in: a-proteobacteria)]MDO5630389.1 hypothetical protein [Paracoccus sp. (in: a-proteobacteria)]
MNMNQLTRMLSRFLLNWGVNAGIRRMGQTQPRPGETREEARKRQQVARQNSSRTRQAMRVLRRFIRF